MPEMKQTALQHRMLSSMVDHIEHLEMLRKEDLALGDQVLATTKNPICSIPVI